MKGEFLEWAEIESDDELERKVRLNYNLAGHNSMMLRRLLRRARVAILSRLPDEKVRVLGLEPVRSVEEGLDWLLEKFQGKFRSAVVPFANVTYATVNDLR